MGIYNACLTGCGGSVLLGIDGRHVCSLCAVEYQDPEIYGDDGPESQFGSQFGWTHMQRITAFTFREEGRTWTEIAAAIGKQPETVRKYFQRNPPGDNREVRNKIADSAMALAEADALS